MENVNYSAQYTEDMLKSFFKYHYRKVFLTWWICGAIIVLSSIVLLVSKVWLNGVLMAIVGIFFLFYPMIVIITSLNSNKRQLNTTDSIEFKLDSMHIASDMFGEEIANQEIKYTVLEKIHEDSKYFYIYTTKVNAYVVDKTKLNESEQNFIRENITKNLAKKK